jgi:hypothetical protein
MKIKDSTNIYFLLVCDNAMMVDHPPLVQKNPPNLDPDSLAATHGLSEIGLPSYAGKHHSSPASQ